MINILSPLIAPLKITRVATGGNLLVHLNNPNQTNERATGWAVINDKSKPVSINQVNQIKYLDHFIKFNTWVEFDEFSVKTYNNLSDQEKK